MSNQAQNPYEERNPMFYDMDKVSWINKHEIRTQAESLLLDYEIIQGIPVEPPIPVEHIIEAYLGFTLEYENLEGILGFNDILGATWLKRKKIVIYITNPDISTIDIDHF